MGNSLIFYITIAIALSVVINIVLKRLGISHIIGYILTGTILTYTFDLHYLADSHSLELVGEFGIAFLMFAIGLEISLAKMATMKNEVFINGTMQVGLSSIIFYLISSYIFELEHVASLIIALALSLSSTAVVLTHLKSSKDIYEPYGQKSVAILIFQDIAAIPILVLIGFLSQDGTQDVSDVLISTILSAMFIFAFLFLAGKKIVSWLLHFSAHSQVEELFIGSVLAIVMGASLFAHSMGFTYSLGAFLAGMLIAETKYHHKVNADIAPFKDLLLGTFFLTVGMKIDLAYAFLHMQEILLVVGAVFILKGMIIFIVIRKNTNTKTAHKTALSLSQVGEFSFAIFALASSSLLISQELTNLLVLVVVISMIVTPFILSNIESIMDLFFKEKMPVRDLSALTQKKDHVIICGYNKASKYIIEELEQRGASYIVIDNNLKHVREALNAGKEAYYGDVSKQSILTSLHTQDASSVIVAIDNTQKKRLICEAILNNAKGVNLVVEVANSKERDDLSDLHIPIIIEAQKEVASIIVNQTISCNLKCDV
ncbi:MAG: potassium transporter [Helicobacteraceae bacterium]|nr:potassium transporter [Helicobacteraceae bacterium]